MKNQKKCFAFTLIELLVVIGIISILLTVGAVSYSTAQKKARDAKRKSDVSSIRSAFEQYYSINNFQYPVTSASALSGSLTSNTITLLEYPRDPTGGWYQCTSSCSAASFSICTTLEAESPNSFCVQNQQ